MTAAGTAKENRQLVADQLAAGAGEDGRPVAEARLLLTAVAGGEASDATPPRIDGTTDQIRYVAGRSGEQATGRTSAATTERKAPSVEGIAAKRARLCFWKAQGGQTNVFSGALTVRNHIAIAFRPVRW